MGLGLREGTGFRVARVVKVQGKPKAVTPWPPKDPRETSRTGKSIV